MRVNECDTESSDHSVCGGKRKVKWVWSIAPYITFDWMPKCMRKHVDCPYGHLEDSAIDAKDVCVHTWGYSSRQTALVKNLLWRQTLHSFTLFVNHIDFGKRRPLLFAMMPRYRLFNNAFNWGFTWPSIQVVKQFFTLVCLWEETYWFWISIQLADVKVWISLFHITVSPCGRVLPLHLEIWTEVNHKNKIPSHWWLE